MQHGWDGLYSLLLHHGMFFIILGIVGVGWVQRIGVNHSESDTRVRSATEDPCSVAKVILIMNGPTALHFRGNGGGQTARNQKAWQLCTIS